VVIKQLKYTMVAAFHQFEPLSDCKKNEFFQISARGSLNIFFLKKGDCFHECNGTAPFAGTKM